jgi:Cu(I)/Ag(I) efflux system membrane protein CusA/SilA
VIEAIIHWSVTNRFFVVLAALLLAASGSFALRNTPVDAIPDLSDVQVIIKTSYPGQAPQVVEDQVTYPLTTAMLSVPGAVTVRGFSFFGDSYVYVIFDDATDLYWARSRVLEYLTQVATSLPETATPQLGPDATGVGWVYVYAISDPTGQHDLSELRSLQDFFLKYQLQTVPGVSEVATLGGMVRQYQVEADPEKLRAFGIPLSHIETAITRANQEVGASVRLARRLWSFPRLSTWSAPRVISRASRTWPGYRSAWIPTAHHCCSRMSPGSAPAHKCAEV